MSLRPLRLWQAGVSAAAVLATVTSSPAAVRFVSPTGSDAANDCLGSVAPCRTLGYAVGQSASGDTVDLAKGRYTGPVTIGGAPGITLTLEGGWSGDFTTRDVERNPSVVKGARASFVFTLDAPASSVIDVTLDGLKITKGTWGGIEATGEGDGTLTLAIAHCTLLGNKGGNGFGGALTARPREASSFHIAITDSTFKGNRAGVQAFFGGAPGGAIDVSGTTGTGNVILDVARSQFVGNVSKYDAGGAIAIFPGAAFTLAVSDSTFVKNKAAKSGGAIAFDGPNGGPFQLDVTNSLFAANRSVHADGGAVSFLAMAGSAHLTNCTMTRNRADTTGGAVSLAFLPAAALTNVIAWDDDATSGADVYAADTGLTVDHDDIGDLSTLNGSITDLGGNIAADPALVRPPNDLHLTAGSPAVDTGTCTGAPSSDFEGDPRPSGAGCDIGADEFVP